jgi:hypothetical protein
LPLATVGGVFRASSPQVQHAPSSKVRNLFRFVLIALAVVNLCRIHAKIYLRKIFAKPLAHLPTRLYMHSHKANDCCAAPRLQVSLQLQ